MAALVGRLEDLGVDHYCHLAMPTMVVDLLESGDVGWVDSMAPDSNLWFCLCLAVASLCPGPC